MKRKGLPDLLIAVLLVYFSLQACSAGPSAASRNTHTDPAAEPQSPISALPPTNDSPTGIPESPPEPTPQPEPENIIDLVEKGAVEFRVQGNGLEYLNLELRKLIDGLLELEIPAGTFFISHSAGIQNMVVRRTANMTLRSDDWVGISLEAACANMELTAPSDSHSFHMERASSQAELGPLMQTLEQTHLSYDVIQAAVWIVTDNADYDDLGTLVDNFGFGDRMIDADDAARAMFFVDKSGVDITTRAVWMDREFLTNHCQNPGLVRWLTEREDTPPDPEQPDSAAEEGPFTFHQLLEIDEGILNFVAAPDGQLILLACSQRTGLSCDSASLYRYDPYSNTTALMLESVPSPQLALDISPDGSTVAVATCSAGLRLICDETEIWLVESSSGEVTATLSVQPGNADQLLFSPDGRYLVSRIHTEVEEYMFSQEIRIRDLEQDLWISTISGSFGLIPDRMAFSPDNRWLITSACPDHEEGFSCDNTGVWFIDPSTGEIDHRLSTGMYNLWVLALTPDGSGLVGIGNLIGTQYTETLVHMNLETGLVSTGPLPYPDQILCPGVDIAADDTLVYGFCEYDRDYNRIGLEINFGDINNFENSESISGAPLTSMLRIAHTPDGMLFVLDNQYDGRMGIWTSNP